MHCPAIKFKVMGGAADRFLSNASPIDSHLELPSKMNPLRFGIARGIPVLVALSSGAAVTAIEPPRCIDAGTTIELVMSEPEIVTPVSCRFDSRGRLFVVESHTHFPPEDYAGPKFDSIKVLDDSDGDGTLDRARVFHQATVKTMSMAIDRDDDVYVATRAAILRLRDTSGDNVADDIATLVELDTTADYPHNGLSGLLIEYRGADPSQGTITFGMGENFGADYVLRGSDGRELTGGGEGGNIFECNLDGSEIRRVATGFWNPFGICRDTAGRLLMVDNDADAMPPCRIADVVEQGDYGFQFRFGRAGTHPLQAWDGELPGTLPMVAGTGEAPCAILEHRGFYWVTSWGDNRIERYVPETAEGALRATQSIAIVGDANFRPVDMAIAADGSMYVTDWVDRSYNVHGKGRIWRIRWNDADAPFQKPLPRSHDELARLALPDADMAAARRAMQSDRPFDWQAGVERASRDESFLQASISDLPTAKERLGWLAAHRWNHLVSEDRDQRIPEITRMLRAALSDRDESVRLAAVRWAAERRIEPLMQEVETQLTHGDLSPRMLAATIAGLSFMESGRVEKGPFDALTRRRLLSLVSDADRPTSIRRSALMLVPPDAPQWDAGLLESLVLHGERPLARSAARHVGVAALQNQKMRELANQLTSSAPETLRSDLSIGLHARSQAQAPDTRASRPSIDDLDAWMKLVGEGGDADRGWKVFFGGEGAKCGSCHMRDGRGVGVGPDLTSIAATQDRRRILESILHPSREMGPMYVPWNVLTTDGRVLTGMKLNAGGVGNSMRFLAADASIFEVAVRDVEFQEPASQSIMPAGLEQLMAIEQLRDLLAFLQSPPE